MDAGGTPRDLLLARLAFRKGLVTATQLADCLAERAASASLSNPPPLAAVLLGKGFLTDEALQELLLALADDTAATVDLSSATLRHEGFGRRLIAQGLATEAQVHDALDIQAQLETHGLALRLAEVLVGRGVLTEAAVRAALALPVAAAPPALAPAINAQAASGPTAAVRRSTDTKAVRPGTGPAPRPAATPRPAPPPAPDHTLAPCADDASPPPQPPPPARRSTSGTAVFHRVAAPPPAPPGTLDPSPAGRTVAYDYGRDLPQQPGVAGGATPADVPALPGPASGGVPGADGERFGRYRLLAELGRGGMGVVYKAWDEQLQRIVALKTYLPQADPSAEAKQRFLVEARAAARLRHPSIVQVHDVSTVDGRDYFTMDFIDGKSLEAVKRELPLRRCLEILRDVAEALDSAHEAGVVHRDVKPANVLLDSSGRPYITDFGLAKEVKQAAAQGMTVTGAIMGTPQYMAPEQARGDLKRIGPRTDIWSLGVILYDQLAGQLPFRGQSLVQVILAIAEADVVPPSRAMVPAYRGRRVPPDLETICLKCLERDPSARYRRAGKLAEDLTRYLNGEAIEARSASGASRVMRKAARHKSAVLPALIAGVLCTAMGAWVFHESLRKDRAVADALRDGSAAEASAGRAASDDEALSKYRLAGSAYQLALAIGPSPVAVEGLRRTKAREKEIEDRRLAAVDDARTKARLEEEARATFEKARAELDRAFRSVYDKNAVFAEVDRRLDAEIKAIDAALPKGGASPTGYYLLGLAWELKGWEDRAELCWRKALAVEPGFGPAHFRLGRMLLGRAFLEKEGSSLHERQVRRVEAERLAAEAAKEFESASTSRTAIDDPLQREVATGMLAFVREDFPRLRELTRSALARFGDVQGAEELHWLSGLASTGGERIRALDRALELRPRYWVALVTRGKAKSACGDLDGAVADFDLAIRANPRFVEAYAGLGDLLKGRGNPAAAIEKYNQALDIAPRYATAYAHRGSARLDKGDNDGAILDFSKALDLEPSFQEAWCNRGVAKKRKGDNDGALADYNQALTLDPKDAWSYRARANAKRDKKDVEGAIADYTHAVELDPKDASSYYFRAELKKDHKDLDGALADYSKALELEPDHTVAYGGRALVRKEKGDTVGSTSDFVRFYVSSAREKLTEEAYDKAISLCDDALRLEPRSADAYHQRGRARQEKGELDAALADYQHAVDLDPRHAAAFRDRGLARRAKKDADGAIADFTRALELDPKLPMVRTWRGRSLLERGDLQPALADLNAVIAAEPKNDWAFFERGKTRHALGEYDAALADFDQALVLDPKWASGYDCRGLTRLAKKDYDGAIADFNSALAILPRFAGAFADRGAAHRGKGELDLALADLGRAIDIDPTLAKAYVERGLARLTKGDPEAALSNFEDAIARGSTDPEAFFGRGSLRQGRGEVDATIQDLTRALELGGPNWGRKKEAQELLDRVGKARGIK
ncbi:MAG: tetratricopeptide repeat protein [Planctomycetes bacterium]|nr:tetratricopeptide repeat protein [Planctomycetota bacterium]